MIVQVRSVPAETWTDYVDALFDSPGAPGIFTPALCEAIAASRFFEAARQVWRLGGHRSVARRLLLRAVLDADTSA